MKYSLLLILVFGIFSTDFALSAKNDKPDIYYDNLLDIMVEALKSIRKGLLEERKFKDLAKVEFNRFMLNGQTRSKLHKTIDFTVKHEKYWINLTDEVNQWTSTHDSVVLRLFDALQNILQEIAKGLLSDQKLIEFGKAVKLGSEFKIQVKPVIKATLNLMEKYEKLTEGQSMFLKKENLQSDDKTDEEERNRKLIEQYIDVIVSYLTKIQQGLIKDNRIIETGKVQLLKKMIDRETRSILISSLNLVIKHRKYLANFDPEGSDEGNLLLIIINDTLVLLGKIERSLIKDGRTLEVGKVQIAERLLKYRARPVTNQVLNTIEKYIDYLVDE